MRFVYLRSVALLFVLGFTSTMAIGQAAVDSLKNRLLNQSVTVKIQGLRCSHGFIFRNVDIRIVDGVVQKRAISTDATTDEVLNPGDKVSVKKIATSSDRNNDFVRLTVAAADGLTVPVAFMLPKGSLATEGEPQLEQLVGTVFDLSGSGGGNGGAMPGVPTPPAPIDQPMQAIPPPPSLPEEASKNADLQPAAPGFPPMHPSAPAPEGCHYEPYYSAKFKVELAYLKCVGVNANDNIVPAESGDALVAKRGDGYAYPMFHIYSKHADETLAAAVKRVVIGKMKDPAARTGCKVSAAESTWTKNPTVQVSPTPTYAKHSGNPCDGLGGNDDESFSFVSFPDDSKMVFIKYIEGKGDPQFDPATIHFLSGGASSTATPEPDTDSTTSVAKAKRTSTEPNSVGGARIPPMQDIWLSQGRTSRDLANEASTVVSFTHGMMLDSSGGNAILAVSCEKSRQGTPVLMLHAEIPNYQGMQQTLANKTGTVSVGKSRHDEQLVTQPGAHFLDVAAPLNQNDVAEMSATQLAGQRTFSLMYFGGAGRDIAAGDLPPANAALDAVLNACSITTPPRIVAQPERQLSPNDVAHLQLTKLSLGMSEAEAKQALGAGYRFQPGDGGKFKNLSFLLAADSSNIYGMTFFDHALRAFTYKKSFAPGAQPLVMNLINSLTAKTWLPLVGGSARVTAWSTDANGVPIVVANQNAHPNCGVVHQDGNAVPPPFSGATTVNLLDTGPDCGVTVRLELSQGEDKSMARDMVLLVVDYRPIHALVSGVQTQQQQQKIDQQKKAGQVATPF